MSCCSRASLKAARDRQETAVTDARQGVLDKTGETGEATSKAPRLRVSELLKGHREAILEHEGQDYRLRITNNGKLILTK